ncbi:MAG: hypothetical protein DPW11_01095 [bacterium]|nr:hypothetical protein [Candidatus Microgenomates bacterium CPR3]MCQ3944363.1 hypothetical protein [bacterium]RIK51288.1 MAG: hypothetical protein DCC61_02900 [Candidatus Microgenomates bacterium]
MQKYVLTHLPMAVGYGLFIFVIKGLFPIEGLAHYLNWMGWVLGVIIGVLLLFIDRIVYTYSYPGTQIAQQFSWYWKQKQYITALTLLYERRLEAERLTFRSSLFMVVWVPLAFFAVTSTPQLFGKGVVMGVMLHILYDSWRLQKKDPRRLHLRLFWLIKRVVTDEEQLVFLWVVTGIFGVLSLWVG